MKAGSGILIYAYKKPMQYRQRSDLGQEGRFSGRIRLKGNYYLIQTLD